MSESDGFAKLIKNKTVKKEDSFRGRSQSSWMAEWVQWMHGHAVNYAGLNGEALFTRGGLSYGYKFAGAARTQVAPDYKEEVFITNNVPIYVNLRTAFYFTGEPHPFGNLTTLTNVLAACRDDHSRGTIKQNEIVKLTNRENIDDPANPRAPLDSNYVESFGVNVTVDPHSVLADEFEFPVEKGAPLNGCAVGDICILRSLPDGDYAIITSNTGARGYTSSSTFIIHVGTSRFIYPF